MVLYTFDNLAPGQYMAICRKKNPLGHRFPTLNSQPMAQVLVHNK